MCNDYFFQEIYRQTYEGLLRYITNVCRNRDMAEDILQETYFEALVQCDALRQHKNVRGWLYKTAGYKMRNYIRKYKKAGVDLDAVQEFGGCDNLYGEAEWKMTLCRLLGKEEAKIFWQYYVLGCTGSELAMQLGITENCLKVRMHRYRKKVLEGICLEISAAR